MGRDIRGKGPRITRTGAMPFVLIMGVTVVLSMYCSRDSEAPIVSISSPAGGAVVSDTVRIMIGATDNETVVQVELYIDSSLVATLASPPYYYDWATNGLADSSSHTIHATAVDEAENEGVSGVKSVMVYNGIIHVLIWNYDNSDLFYDDEANATVDCAYGLREAVLANGYLCQTSSSLPPDLSRYLAVFVTTGWFRC